MYVNHVYQAHQGNVRRLCVERETGKVFSAGMDGQVMTFGPETDPDMLAKLAPITSACMDGQRLVICAEDGVVLRIGDDSVDELPLRLKNRPRAVCSYNGLLVASDVEGIIYYAGETYQFAPFEHGGRSVPNGVNDLCVHGDFLAAATSSGHICLFDLSKPITAGPACGVAVHRAPARAVVLVGCCGGGGGSDDCGSGSHCACANGVNSNGCACGCSSGNGSGSPHNCGSVNGGGSGSPRPTPRPRAFFSGGNDGRVFYTYRAKSEWRSRAISPRALEAEYAMALDFDAQSGLLAAAGTGPLAFVLDVAGLLKSPDSAVPIAAAVPLRADSWCAALSGKSAYFGCENGEIVAIEPDFSDFHAQYIKTWRPLQVPEAKYAGGGDNLLDCARLRGDFDYGDLAVVAEIAPEPPLFLCCLRGQIAVVCQSGGIYFIYGYISINQRKKVADSENRKWDMEYDIRPENAPGKQFKLYMNAGEDSYTAGMRFLAESGLMGDSQTDQVDYIQQIREFIEKNAPKMAISDFVFPDAQALTQAREVVCFEAAPPGLASIDGPAEGANPAGGTMDLAFAAAQPKEISEEYARRAYSHIQAEFGGVDLIAAAQCVRGSVSQLQELRGGTGKQLAAFLCICAYYVEVNTLELEFFQPDFQTELVAIFMTAEEDAVVVMAGKLLARMCGVVALSEMRGRIGELFNRACDFLPQEDVEALCVRIVRSLGPGGESKALSQLYYEWQNDE